MKQRKCHKLDEPVFKMVDRKETKKNSMAFNQEMNGKKKELAEYEIKIKHLFPAKFTFSDKNGNSQQ